MKLIAQIPYNEVEFVWESNHWDVPLEGLCLYKKKYCRFSSDGVIGFNEEIDEQVIDQYRIYSLNWYEKFRWLMRKKLFEWCVGYHWTYYNGKRIYEYRYAREKSGLIHNIILTLYYRKWRMFWNRP